ncbi:SDR family oxidoreductase [Microbacterium sp. ZXX196]|uniref:SDR family oxidoreductase n=1 Tax=Microbacterium sp. ZXX196 TaxID=2609291 RepID=UPI0012B77B27|nr:SDR family oxidoreductase [Microbacterium sp. ZXX196]MTE24213.1 NAD(P)H-binding protein [Microbacterium sp. ZXX196]
MTILVTGATGQLGRLVADALLARGASAADIRLGARDVAKAADLAERGFEVAHLDYDDAASVASAVAGADAVLLISGSAVGQRVPQHRAVIDAAAAAGVTKLVYTSVTKATTTDLLLAPEHKATEEAIAASGVPAVILRNGWYTENYAGDVAQAAESGAIAKSAGDGRVASAARRDFAEAAAVVLLEDGHVGEIYELAGDEAWSFDDLAAAATEITGREVVYRRLTLEEQTAALTEAGLDAGTIGFLTGLDQNIAAGDLAFTDGTLARLIGRPTTPLTAALRAA